jgi:DNA-binding transcriptional MerR regulator
MKISEAAGAARVNVQTLRYYERRGLLPEPPRTDSGHRDYDRESVQIVRFIKSAQELGFTLAEIRDLLVVRSSGRDDREQVRRTAERRLHDIEDRISRLDALRSTMLRLLEDCRGVEDPSACPILDTLEPENAPE